MKINSQTPYNQHIDLSTQTDSPEKPTLSPELSQDLQELKEFLTKMGDQTLSTSAKNDLKDLLVTVLHKYCNNAGKDQDVLNLELEKAGLIQVRNFGSDNYSLEENTRIEDPYEFHADLVSKLIIPKIQEMLSQ